MMSSGSGIGYNQPQFSSSHTSQHGIILRQKSIGVADEERGSLHPPTMKLSRSLSVPGPEDIPPPPDTSAPEPPLSSGGRRPEPIHSGPPAHFLTHAQTGMAPPVSRAGSRRDSADAIRKGGAKMGVLRRGYSNATPPSNITSAAPKQAIAKAAGRRGGGKGPLLKQPKVEDGGVPLRSQMQTQSRVMDKSSIPIPTIIVKAPSTSSSGRSSQGSSIDAEPPAELDQDKESESINPSVSRPSPPSMPVPLAQDQKDHVGPPGGDVMSSTKRERKRFRDSGRKSASFFYSSEEDVLDETATNQTERTSPRLRSSKSIDEGLFAGDSLNDQGLSMPPAFGLPQYASPHTHRHAQATTFIHPLTGKVLDPASPLGLALAARERALKDDRRTCREERHFGRQMSSSGVFPSTVSMTSPHNPPTPFIYQPPGSVYIAGPSQSTMIPSGPESSRLLQQTGIVVGTGSRAGELEKEAREGLRVRFTEDRQEDVQYQSQYHNQYQNQYQTQDHNQYHDQYQWDWQHEHERGEVMLKSMSSCVQKPPQTNQQPSSRRQSLLCMESEDTANSLGYARTQAATISTLSAQELDASGRRKDVVETDVGLMVLPPPAPSVDVDDEFVFSDPLPPPLQFANGSDHGLQGSPTYTQQQQHLQQPQQKDLHNQHIQQQDELQLQSQQQSSVTIEEQQLSHQPSAIVHPFLFPPSPLIPPPQLCPKIPASNITLPSTTSNSPSQPLLHHLSQAATPQITSNTYTPHTLRRSGQGSNIEPFPNSAAVTPHSPHIPQAGDSAASSLTSYDSEVANLTQLALSPCLPSPQSFPPTTSPSTLKHSVRPPPAPPSAGSQSLHRPLPLFYTASQGQDCGNGSLTTVTYSTMTTSPALYAVSTTTAAGTIAPSNQHPQAPRQGGRKWQHAVVDCGMGESEGSKVHPLDVLGMREGDRGRRRESVESGGLGQVKEGSQTDRRVSLDSSMAFRIHNNGTHRWTNQSGRPVPLLQRQTSAAPFLQHTPKQKEDEDEGLGCEPGAIKGPLFLDYRLSSPLSSVKASIISELSNKLQQIGGWQDQREHATVR
uniref:Uncharacterized protein n=2 Tax=Denticeps clupeoides TaxID=299321 RepID=A0AAY4C1J6_9TELE